MKGRYVKVATKFWTDEKTIELSPPTKLLHLYILTSPHSNMAGYYRLPKAYIKADLELSDKQLDKGFNKLLDIGLIKYCPKSSVIIIPNYYKYNSIQNKNQAKGAANRTSELPRNSLVKDYKEAINTYAGNYDKELMKGLPKGFNKRFSKQSGNTDTDTDTDTDTELDKYADEIKKIHSHWLNLLSDINKPGLTKNQKETILTKIKKWDQNKIIQSITNYAEVYRSDYYYSHNFTMFKFIKYGNGAPRFLPGLDSKYDGDIWKDYLQNTEREKENSKNEMLKELYAEAQQEDEQGEGEVDVL